MGTLGRLIARPVFVLSQQRGTASSAVEPPGMRLD